MNENEVAESLVARLNTLLRSEDCPLNKLAEQQGFLECRALLCDVEKISVNRNVDLKIIHFDNEKLVEKTTIGNSEVRTTRLSTCQNHTRIFLYNEPHQSTEIRLPIPLDDSPNSHQRTGQSGAICQALLRSA
jgi:hypothetical protein